MGHFRLIALILTEILPEIGKLTHQLTLSESEIAFIEATYPISDS